MKSTKGELFVRNDRKNKATVEIYGQKYTFVGKVSESYIQEIAAFVDEKMNELAEKNPSLDMTRVAVLTAVNLAEDYFSFQKDYEDLLKLIEEQTKNEKSK